MLTQMLLGFLTTLSIGNKQPHLLYFKISDYKSESSILEHLQPMLKLKYQHICLSL